MATSFLAAVSLVLAVSNPVLVYVKHGGTGGAAQVMTSGRGGESTLGIFQPESNGELIAALSPDGQRVAFISSGELWTAPVFMRSGGRGPYCSVKRLDNGHWEGAVKAAVRAAGPLSWSPDGLSLLFIRPNDSGGPGGTIIRLTTTPRGTGLSEAHVMVGREAGKDGNPSFFPDGSTILFDRLVEGKGRRLHTVRSDGKNLTDITPAHGDWVAGSCSPDGSRIVARRLAPDDSQDLSGIYLMNRDGRGLQFIEGSSPDDERPLFSPEGDEVIFARRPPASAKGGRGVFIAGAGDGRPPIRFRGIGEPNSIPVQWIDLR